MPLRFRKMHVNGDDFVVTDMSGAAGAVTGDLARRLGDRHRGIGFNQLAVMLDCADAASKLIFGIRTARSWMPVGVLLAVWRTS
jgi:diaminopimelate epimerase